MTAPLPSIFVINNGCPTQFSFVSLFPSCYFYPVELIFIPLFDFLCFLTGGCCGVGVDEANPQEPVSSGTGGVAGGGGVSVIPDRPPLELDKLPPYHDVTPTPGKLLTNKRVQIEL